MEGWVVSIVDNENAVLHAQAAAMRGEIARLRADNGHLRRRLGIVSERDLLRAQRGIDALLAVTGCHVDLTGFCPHGRL